VASVVDAADEGVLLAVPLVAAAALLDDALAAAAAEMDVALDVAATELPGAAAGAAVETCALLVLLAPAALVVLGAAEVVCALTEVAEGAGETAFCATAFFSTSSLKIGCPA
jgi:hypothetical protein